MTDFDYVATRNDIIKAAFRILGVIEASQSLTGRMLEQGVEALELLVKSWSNEHLFLWSFNETSFATVISQTVYTSSFNQDLIGLDKAWYIDDSNYRQEMEVVSYSRYLDIREVGTDQGFPRVIAYKSTPDPSFYIWPTPSQVRTIKALCIIPLKDMDDPDEHGDIPARFQRALKYGLAEDLFDEYPGAMNEREFISNKAANLFRAARKFDTPVETNDEIQGLYSNRR